MPNLLIELFSEEIPARMQARAADDLKKLVTDGLVEAGLTYAGAAAFSTPRRLALAVDGVLAESPTIREERKGPRVDAPEKAIEGFLRGAGVSKDQLEIRDEKKGQVYFATITRPGRPAAKIVAEVLESAIRGFPWPKAMLWGAGQLRWVRPLHSILCILTDDAGEASVVPLEIDGIKAGNTTEGHRFMGSGRFAVTGFDDYAARLKRDRVVLDATERADHIWQEATNLAFAQGLQVVEDRGLLAEVAGLVEWPVVLMGAINAEFLDLPPEVLQTSMKEHQKFFSVRNPKTGRIEKFITVANRETADHGATILAGNQKVLAARLSDAKFFWENDLRTIREKGLEGMAAGLSDVTFHNKLGSQADRIKRIEALAREIAPMVGAKPDLAAEAARVAKADLQSEMVGEFPELQGLMGRYYAQAAGHDDGVPEACEEHYKPLGPGDAVPSAPVSVAVALADKIDTLTGFWAIDEKPTGSKDPYALRRAALGVIRLVLGNGLRFQIETILEMETREHATHQFVADGKANDTSNPFYRLLAFDRLRDGIRDPKVRRELTEKFLQGENTLRESDNDHGAIFERSLEKLNLDILHVTESVLAFLHDRLKVHLRDEGIRHDVIDACLAMELNDDLTLLVKRAEALADFLKTDDGDNLLQGFKRANNILTQAEEKDGVEYAFGADVKFAETPEEKALFAALDAADAKIGPAMAAEDYATAMAAMADMRAPIDAFFEAVQVNAENQVVRRNRLNLLSRIRAICLAVADLTRIEG
ncbi:glycine--tRNA ligase subunit beta [Lutimaribacter sp. EGI FJ00015]|uniref:Glycine--tRNA ligase subunit beta n=1 Tax=Lutimaribacter degradans TaxID=2945989 RepID=A0ACC5ZQY3_9RHOB|nr:glycine--tRNA ligase subunit beta [Lutimaribacter sp. EGI FJ00013]MCM2560711.1 glycine--tRNA ligase subunit beta [Lutimaribacter sp. EGI FJ00013]MCO0612344.1 glycine--tRNA ligase subunit beta [Lutimaribacter sp. EGI FJ00015]MCO0634536.1 glycine--tRNA ligase subunit beta [Lutimaribacter sp. EGI FJ00014]